MFRGKSMYFCDPIDEKLQNGTKKPLKALRIYEMG